MIAVLDRHTIDKIAAGEVVERPASIVKELVENAIDAGASSISIEIQDGGIGLIRVTDNGSGIAKDELKTSCLRHATSKISKAADLDSIQTLGFRGEALSSISGVARCEFITKTQEALLGSRYVIEGGVDVSFEEIGVPKGTTVIVRDIFFNTPARKKFLKSASTEAAYISDLIEKLMLSKLDVAIRYIVGNQTKLQSLGNGELKDVIYQIYGRDIYKALVEVYYEKDGIKISGYIAKPEIAKANRSSLIYFVNSRYIKDKTIAKAIEDAYGDKMMQHKYPFAVLHIDIASTMLDVNVHPSKMEVRFSDNSYVYSHVREAVENAFLNLDLIRKSAIEKQIKEPKRIEARAAEPFEEGRTLIRESVNKVSDIEKADFIEESKDISIVIEEDKSSGFNTYKSQADMFVEGTVRTDNVVSKEQLSFVDSESRAKHRLVGQIFDTYWIIEFNKYIYMIDQHAAHEKVLYERFLKQFDSRSIESQYISPATIVELSHKEADALERHKTEIESLGFEVEYFGGREYSLSAIPAILPSISKEQWFKELVNELSIVGSIQNTRTIIEKLASLSCKAAIKGGQSISIQEADILIDELLRLDNPYNCPHGRPTIIKMSKYDIEKKFKRIL